MKKAVLYSFIVCLFLSFPVFGAHNGVPHLVITDFDQDVEDWWYAHPFNPVGPNYDPVILSPDPTITLSEGDSIQAAIDSLPANGGTIILNAGIYNGKFDIIGRSNVHILGQGDVTIVSPDFEGAQGCNLFSCAEQADYGAFDSCLFNTPWPDDCWQCYLNPTSNFYFKNLNFEGNESVLYSFLIQGPEDIVFDDCHWTNFNLDYLIGNWRTINSKVGSDNIWFWDCSFEGTQRFAVYLDGSFGSGMVNCRVEGTYRSGFLFMTNDDYTDDVDNDGVLEINEKRQTNYAVVTDCSFGAPLLEVVAATGSHVLIQNNTVDGNVNTFVRFTARSLDHPYWAPERYEHYGMKVIGNTVPGCYLEFAQFHNVGYDFGDQGQIPRLGGYEIRGNTCNYIRDYGFIREINPVDCPRIVCGNCVTHCANCDPSLDVVCPADVNCMPPEDLTPPDAPQNVRAGLVTFSSAVIEWDGASDDQCLKGYRIYRDGNPIAEVSFEKLSYVDMNLADNTVYEYVVSSVDYAENETTASELEIRTQRIPPIDNLVMNSSFEEGEEGLWPSDWQARNEGYQDRTTAVNGSASLAVTSAANKYTYQNFSLIPGQEYVLSGYVKTDGVHSGTGLFLRYVFFDPTQIQSTSKVTGTADWTYLHTNFTGPAQAANEGRLDLFWDFSSGSGWFDEISLNEAIAEDLNMDNRIDSADLEILAASWLEVDAEMDMDGSGRVDMGELANLAYGWLYGAY